MKSWNYQNELLLARVCLKVLKDSKKTNKIKQWAATSCSKSRNFCIVYKLVARDHQMTLKLIEDQLHFTQTIGERARWIKVSLTQSHARANSTLTMKCFLVNCSMVQIRDLPHSCDLEPAEFFISQSENSPQQIFEHQNIRKNVTRQIRCSSFGHLQWPFYTTFWNT